MSQVVEQLSSISFERLSSDTLKALIDCDDIEKIDQTFQNNYLINNKLSKTIQDCQHSRILEKAIDDSSDLLDAYWNAVSLVSVGVAALPLTVAILGLTMIYGGYNLYSHAEAAKVKKKKNIQFFQLAELQLQASEVLVRRLSYDLDLEFSPHHEVESKPTPALKAEAATAGFKVSFSLFGAYYLSTAWIFEELMFSGAMLAMTGPVALAIAAGVAILIGAYCAYQHYQVKQAKAVIEHEKNKITHTLKARHAECYSLLGRAHSLGFFQYSSVENAATLPDSQRPLTSHLLSHGFS